MPEAARPSTGRQIWNDEPSGIPTRLEQMDDAGVRMQVLSPAASPPYAEKETEPLYEEMLLCASQACRPRTSTRSSTTTRRPCWVSSTSRTGARGEGMEHIDRPPHIETLAQP